MAGHISKQQFVSAKQDFSPVGYFRLGQAYRDGLKRYHFKRTLTPAPSFTEANDTTEDATNRGTAILDIPREPRAHEITGRMRRIVDALGTAKIYQSETIKQESDGRLTVRLLPGGQSYLESALVGSDYGLRLDLDQTDARYLTKPGVAGGQTASGGNAAGEELILSSTSDGVKGKIRFGTEEAVDSAYDEFNKRLGIGTQSPDETVHIRGETPIKFLFERIGGSAGSSGQFRGRRALGTIVSKSVVTDGDTCLLLNGEGYAGPTNEYQPVAQFQFNVDGTPTDDVNGVPGEMVLKISDGVGNLQSCIRMRSNFSVFFERGNVLIGTSGLNKIGSGANASLIFVNGTVPTTQPTDTVHVYAEDVSSSAVLKVMPEDGNVVSLYQVASGYTTANVTTDRDFDADSTTLAEVADVLSTLIEDLKLTGLIA